jgi:sporulation integral membrane protein YtvI
LLKKINFKSKIILIPLITLVGIIFARLIFPYTAPFIFAIVIAVLIDPLVGFFQNKLRLPRGLAVLLVLILFFLILILITTNLLITAYTELQILYSKETVIDFSVVEEWFNSFKTLQQYIPDTISDAVEESISEVNQLINTVARSLFTTIFNIIKDIPRIVLYTFVTFLATFFMSKDKEKVQKGLLTLIPEKYHQQIISVRNGILAGSMGYIRAQFILILISTSIATICFLALDLRYVVVLAILIIIMDLIPVVGPSVVFVPLVIWSLVEGQFLRALVLLITHGTITATRQILEPKLVGDRIGVHPLITLFALFLGTRLLGVIGLFVAPLLVIMIKSILFTTEEINSNIHESGGEAVKTKSSERVATEHVVSEVRQFEGSSNTEESIEEK